MTKLSNRKISPEDAVKAFYQISGMEISFTVDKFQSAVVICRCKKENLCSMIQRNPVCLERCKESDLIHLNDVKDSGESKIYTCPFGIREAILPIKQNNRVVGMLFCSMGIFNGYSIEKIVAAAKQLFPSLSKDEILSSLATMPKITDEEEAAYFKLLNILKEYIEGCNILDVKEQTLGTRIKSYINDNLARKMTLADLSWNFHLSTVTLTQHFKAEFGISIMEYVTAKRMELARELLTESDQPLHIIAQQCGYPDVEYFSRSFKKSCGISPGMWRKANQAKTPPLQCH